MSFKPNRLRSQNFLIDEDTLQKIIEAADLQPEDLVIEVGAGTGNLTKELIQSAAKVIAIEKDPRTRPLLSPLESDQFTLLIQDILEFDFLSLDQYKIVANLPYHITQKILQRICKAASHITKAIVMVQKEVAQKLLHDQISSPFVLDIQLHFSIEVLCQVSKKCFFPQPKVDSTVLILHPIPCPQNAQKIVEMAKIGFHSKRKKLCNNLEKFVEKAKVLSAFAKLELSENIRAEMLDKDEWISLYRLLAKE